MNRIRVCVLGMNSGDQPEFYWCSVEMEQSDIDEGLHYEEARERAIANGILAWAVFDEHSQAAREVPELASFLAGVSTVEAAEAAG